MKASSYDYEGAYRHLEEHPGMRKGELANKAGLFLPSRYEEFLSMLERRGFLVSEDERGNIYPFRRVKIHEN